MSDTPTTPTPTTSTKSYGPARPKVPPFARFRGTSAWRKDRKRVREYMLYRAALAAKALHKA